jgi:uncharacterized membrane protein SirB2
MMYLVLRDVHITCVILSGIGFFLRGCWRLLDSPLYRRRWAKILPHVVDTVLLSSAVALAVISQQYPIEQPWLTAKVIGLLAYIGFGMAAFRFGRSRRQTAVFFVLALGAYAYIVSVALTRHPAAWLAPLF